MKNQTTLFLILSISLLLTLSCKEEPFDLDESFSKIYDHSNAELSFRPVDIAPIENGFVLLTEKKITSSNFTGVSLYILDEFGEYSQEIDLSNDYVLPTGPMSKIGTDIYFFAMEPVTLNTILLSLNSLLEVTEIPLSANIPMPLAINAISNDRFLLLSYNGVDLESVLSVISIDGTVSQSNGYTIGPGSDAQASVLNHFTDPEHSRLPFFCGEYSANNYYFNGFYNYSLSMVFTDLGNTPTGVVQGQGTNGGLSAAFPLSGSNFAILGYQFNDTFMNPNVALSTGAITSSIDLFDSPLAEFRARTRSSITSWTDGSTFIAAETEARQIAIYCYANAGELRSIQRIGFINPYTISAIQTADDGSLLIVGTTFVAGRFERMYFQKFTEKEVAGWLK